MHPTSSPIYPRRPICCGSPWQPHRVVSPVISSTTQLLALALPSPSLGPHVVTPSLPFDIHHLLVRLCAGGLARAVTYMLTTVRAASCQPANLGTDARPLHWERQEGWASKTVEPVQPARPSSTTFSSPFLPSRPLQQLCHMKGKIEPEPRDQKLKRKECPAPLLSPFPSSLIALGSFRGKPAHKCHSRYPIVFGSTVRPLRSVN